MAKQSQNQQEEGQAPPDPLDNVLNYIREGVHEYARTVVIGVVGVVLVVVGVQWYMSQKEAEKNAIWNTMESLEARSRGQQKGQDKSKTISEYESLLEKHAGSSPTPWVLLKLGNARREAGRLEAALSAYRRLKREYGGSTAAEMAGPALAGTLEEMGRYEEAAKEYEKLAAEEGDPYYYLGAGRCRQLAADFEKAKTNYERAKEEAGDGRTDIVELAEFGLNVVARKDKLTVPEQPADMQTMPGLQGGMQRPTPQIAPGKAGKQPAPPAKTKGKKTD